jgi:hypothetical protein
MNADRSFPLLFPSLRAKITWSFLGSCSTCSNEQGHWKSLKQTEGVHMSLHAHKIRLEWDQCTLRSNKVMRRHLLEADLVPERGLFQMPCIGSQLRVPSNQFHSILYGGSLEEALLSLGGRRRLQALPNRALVLRSTR